jgi:hypothetical protein
MSQGPHDEIRLAEGEAGAGRTGEMMKSRKVTSRILRSLLALTAVLCALSLLGSEAQASNMAYKLNKQIFAFTGQGQGRNFVSFPDRGPHSGPGGLTNTCAALNLSPNGTITQFNPVGGTVNTFQCGQLETFAFADQIGAIIQDTAATSGIIVGSDIPGNSFSFADLGSPPIGYNKFPVEYHTTAVTPEDVCTQCALSATATITRFDAQNGFVLTHQCTQLPIWNLVLGEAVLILEDNGPKACVPPHF